MQPNRLRIILSLIAIVAGIGVLIFMLGRQFGSKSQHLEGGVANMLATPPPASFRSQQLESFAVQSALEQKAPGLKAALEALGGTWPPQKVLYVGYKEEAVLEVWVEVKENEPWVMLRSWPFCQDPNAKKIGPTLPNPEQVAGTSKVAPEIPVGLYHIERLFPRDLSYFMAIKLDFPNEADKASMKKGKPFPAVSIRGGCQITGSIHLGTDAIQEAYLPAMEAWAQGGKDIPVYLFPARLTPERSASLAKDLKDKRQKARLEQLTTAFARFDSTHRPLKVSFSPKGEYVVE